MVVSTYFGSKVEVVAAYGADFVQFPHLFVLKMVFTSFSWSNPCKVAKLSAWHAASADAHPAV